MESARRCAPDESAWPEPARHDLDEALEPAYVDVAGLTSPSSLHMRPGVVAAMTRRPRA